jgi:hypothetical protein
MLDDALALLEVYDRLLSGREINPSMLIVDSKTVQNADPPAGGQVLQRKRGMTVQKKSGC